MYDLINKKKCLILGVANEMSIAYSIAKTLKDNGAEIILTYQGDSTKKRVEPIALEFGATAFECDVSKPGAISNLISNVSDSCGKIDHVVHSIAYIDRSELQGRFVDTKLENFLQAMHISCFSLVEIAKYAKEIMNNDGSILTLSYYGAEKVVSNYNAMGVVKSALESAVRYLAADLGAEGIRVNAISAGPIKTLSARVIGNISEMLKVHSASAPLRRGTTQQDVANAALYLLSNLANGVTGEIHYVDCGYNIMAV